MATGQVVSTVSHVRLFGDSFDGLREMRFYKEGGSEWVSYRHRYLLSEILWCAQELKRLSVYVKALWVPSHRGVPGNEAADHIAFREAHSIYWSDQDLNMF